MNLYEPIQTRKAISAYGGIGSLIETRHGALLIQDFEQWPFYKRYSGSQFADFRIQDERFVSRLRRYFTQLKHIVEIPENEFRWDKPTSEHKLLSAEYFPRWFHCPGCNRFDRLDNWQCTWRQLVGQEMSDTPKCAHCHTHTANRKRRHDLEQIRFMMTSPGGDIADVPWDKWTLSSKPAAEEEAPVTVSEDNDAGEEAKKTFLDPSIVVPPGTTFTISTSERFSDLRGITITAHLPDKTKRSRTLRGLFGLRVRKCDLPEFESFSKSTTTFKPVLRSSNSVYYPNILTSLYIPADTSLTEAVASEVKKRAAKLSRTDEEIVGILAEDGYRVTVSQVQWLRANQFNLAVAQTNVSELDYRYQEYRYFTSQQQSNDQHLAFDTLTDLGKYSTLIRKICRIDKLRLTSVLTSYTRQEPVDRDVYLVAEDDPDSRPKVRKKYISSYRDRTYYLPGVEGFGEGIFIELNPEAVQNWLADHPELVTRLMSLQHNLRQAPSVIIQGKNATPAFVLVHTLSHLLIKELEFSCGYPAASLQERLYVEAGRMTGLLIYTVAGAEGSFGGLTSLCRSDKFINMLQSALWRAQHCASDPICWTSDGQGAGNLNLAACYSCAIIPETSCEEFNALLDRRLAIDPAIGYFKAVC